MLNMLRILVGALKNSRLLPALLRRRPRSLAALLGVILSVYGISSNRDAAPTSSAPAPSRAYAPPAPAAGAPLADSGRIFHAFAELRLGAREAERLRPSPTPPAAKPASAPWRTIRQVVDGDSLRLDNGDTVRLMGVDAPEASANAKMAADIGKMGAAVSEDAFVRLGRASAAFTRQVAEGRRCWLEFPEDPRDQRDQYGRYLAYVHFENGAVLNELIIAEGYGKVYLSSALVYARRYIQLQAEAARRKRGLWADG